MKLLKVGFLCGQVKKIHTAHGLALLIGMGLLQRAMFWQIVDKYGQTYSQHLIHIWSGRILLG
ncbi:hypothetical protein JFK97_15715 [Chromobacterium phragmitis]|uniref:hypothetical protein n=1 Tax=Chromobacterium amazonense TaxID=1382803 RepID=UPI0021B778C2|nr:hypothetical protein [Chromobacterium amazonense]MBM2885845.1 hypothetical protein [Chromobacterium amazonense]